MQKTTYQKAAAQYAAEAGARLCEHPDCREPGVHRAPRSRTELDRYYWFCLEHVRAYNQSWNYYAGMDSDEIEAHRRQDTVWQRPTWPFGTRRPTRPGIHDPFGFFQDDPGPRREQARAGERVPPGANARALEVLELTEPLTPQRLKAQYKALVKLHHPDRHGGCKQAEERLKLINQAYTTLRKALGV